MRNKFLSLLFLLLIIINSNASRRKRLHGRRSLPQLIKDMKPVSLGPDGEVNITQLLSRLLGESKAETHMLTAFFPESKKTKIKEERPEELYNKGDWFLDETPKEQKSVTKKLKKTEKKREDVTKYKYGTDFNENVEPNMRNADKIEEGDLVYDIDEEDDLHVSLRK